MDKENVVCIYSKYYLAVMKNEIMPLQENEWNSK
jgi:hypothetical protein